jgi:hypothetical protein
VALSNSSFWRTTRRSASCEQAEHLVGDGARLCQPGDVVELGEGQERLEQRRVVLRVGEVGGAPRTQQAAVVATQLAQQEPRVAPGGFHPVVAVESGGGLGQRIEEQCVPPEEHLVVEARPGPGAPAVEELAPRPPNLLGRFLGPVHDVQDVPGVPGVRVAEVPLRRHAVVAHRFVGVVAAHLAQLVEAPEVELPLHPLRVGVLGGEEAAVGVGEVA